jgi:hypothetical protein
MQICAGYFARAGDAILGGGGVDRWPAGWSRAGAGSLEGMP